MTREKIAYLIVILYDLIILPFRIVRLLLNWWNERIGQAIVNYLAYWVTGNRFHNN